MRRSRRTVALIAASASWLVPGIGNAQSADDNAWRFTGSVFELYTRSRTIVPVPEPYEMSLARLRLRAEGRLPADVSVDLQYDNELLAGSYLRTTQYALAQQRVATSFDLEHEYARGDRLSAQHGLYRATLRWTGPSTDVRIGRQRIALGAGYFWSPMDLLNPIDPARIDREYRVGADAVLVEQKLGATSRAQLMFVPHTSRLDAVGAAYLHGNVRGTDLSVLAGRFRRDRVLGMDVSTSRGGLGLRGELTWTDPDSGSRFARVLLGTDYGFASTLTLSAEAFYNGRGSSELDRYDVAGVSAGRTLSVARWYGGIAATYSLTPIVTIGGFVIMNADDGSAVLWPRVEWSVRSNLDVVAGVQRFSGGERTEYGRVSNVSHASLRWFF